MAHNPNGSLKDNSVTNNNLAPGAVTKTTVGLSNVDNTSDADKPVSGPQLTALDLKADTAALATKLNTTDLDAQTAVKINDNTSATVGALNASYAHLNGGALVINNSPVGGALLATPKTAGTVQLNDEAANPTTGGAIVDGYRRADATGYEARRSWDFAFDTELDASAFSITPNYVLDVDTVATFTGDTTSGGGTITNAVAVSGTGLLGTHLIGFLVTGSGMPANTYVQSATATSVTLTANATATATGATFAIKRPCYRTATTVSVGTFTATNGSPVVTGGSGLTALAAAGTIYTGQTINSNRFPGNTTIKSIDSDSQMTLSVAATAATGTTTITAGGEMQDSFILTKQDIRNSEVYLYYMPKSSTSIASASMRLIAKYLGANNYWDVTKTWNPANASTTGRSVWKGIAAATDTVPAQSPQIYTLGIPRVLRVRFFEDAVLIKDWATYTVFRAGWDPTKQWYKGEGCGYQVTRSGLTNQSEIYVLLNDLAPNTGPVDPATDTTNFARCEEPDWQVIQRIRPAQGGAGSGGATGGGTSTEDNVETGVNGFRSAWLTMSIYAATFVELERRPGNMLLNAQLEHINLYQDSPIFWFRDTSGGIGNVGTFTATRVANSNILTGVTGATVTPLPNEMGLTGSGMRPGAKIMAYDSAAGTITMNVTANASGTSTLTMTNLMDWVDIPGPGHQNAAGVKRRALHFHMLTPAATFWSQIVYNATLRRTNASLQRRSRPAPTVMFPRASEFVMWTKGNNLRNTNGSTLLSAFDLYNYNLESGIIMQWNQAAGIGPVDTYFYPLGPPAAHVQCIRTSGSPVLTGVADTSMLSLGRSVTGIGIPPHDGLTNTWITAIDPVAHTVTLNRNATASGTSVLDFGFVAGDERGDGSGTWDWYPTKFWHVWRGNGQSPHFARLQFGFHGSAMGDLWAADPTVRPVGGQA